MSDRMIVEDPKGRIISVPADSIPKGSKIIRPDVVPGQSENTFESFTSEVINAPSTPEPIITSEGALLNDAGERVNPKGEPIDEMGKVIKVVEEDKPEDKPKDSSRKN